GSVACVTRGAGHGEHARTTPKADRCPGQDDSRLAHPLRGVAGAGQVTQVTTDASAGARGLAVDYQLRRSTRREVQAGLSDTPARAVGKVLLTETCGDRPGGERLLRTKKMIVDQRAGLPKEDQRAA